MDVERKNELIVRCTMINRLLAGGTTFMTIILFFVKGIGIVNDTIVPYWTLTGGMLTVILFAISLPLCIFRKTRVVASLGLFTCCHFLAVSVWLESFSLAFAIGGPVAILVGISLAVVGIIPVALFLSLLHEMWRTVVEYLLAIIVLGIVRTFASFIAEKGVE